MEGLRAGSSRWQQLIWCDYKQPQALNAIMEVHSWHVHIQKIGTLETYFARYNLCTSTCTVLALRTELHHNDCLCEAVAVHPLGFVLNFRRVCACSIGSGVFEGRFWISFHVCLLLSWKFFLSLFHRWCRDLWQSFFLGCICYALHSIVVRELLIWPLN